MDEELHYKALRKIQQNEKTSPQCSKLPDQFYHHVRLLLDTMEKAEESERNSQKKMLLHDEYVQTKKIALSIFEHRERKIVQAALSTMRTGKPELSTLTSEEQRTYESLLSTMKQGRALIWEGTKQEHTTQPKQLETQPIETPNIKKPADKPVKPSFVKNTSTILLITDDIPTFMGTDTQEYSLKKHDIISLPVETAEPLLKRNVAVKV